MSQRDILSWNVILTAYFSNGEFEKALDLLHRIRTEGVKLNFASWNAVISGCMQNGQTKQALEFLTQIQDFGFKPNHITITNIFPVCTNLKSLRGGKEIHRYIIQHQMMGDITTTSALVSHIAGVLEDL
ncbi:hypothetical protein HHK36_006419 [Tetracentron sinense]|uniref:Pentatricopeptide repeat-containing protein n=1 Tax=Tetracentron sinense TaxID=13715 RepID=A0A834ZIZ3_TETSI|nr:hypothetical protein HHK36_006419 [Tetracentron sinense]